MFEVIRIPAFKDNYIWLLRQGTHTAVIDPGDARPVLSLLDREGWPLTAILITHHHADHQGGIAALLAHYPVPVFGPANEPIHGLDRPLRGGETVVLDSLALSLQVIAVPGHTLGHLAYYGAGTLFCGDTLFGGGCGRLFEGSPEQMADSLARLASLPDDTVVYCAHEYTEANLRFALAVEAGNRQLQRRVDEVAVTRAKGLSTIPSTIGIEKATNPFLRCAVPEVIARARQRQPEADDEVAVFATLREWKNHF